MQYAAYRLTQDSQLCWHAIRDLVDLLFRNLTVLSPSSISIEAYGGSETTSLTAVWFAPPAELASVAVFLWVHSHFIPHSHSGDAMAHLDHHPTELMARGDLIKEWQSHSLKEHNE